MPSYKLDDFLIHEGKLYRYLGEEADVLVPEGVKEISENAFIGAKIRSLFLPESLEVIDKRIFGDCSVCSVSELILPQNLVVLNREAFYDVRSLAKVVMLSAPVLTGNMRVNCFFGWVSGELEFASKDSMYEMLRKNYRPIRADNFYVNSPIFYNHSNRRSLEGGAYPGAVTFEDEVAPLVSNGWSVRYREDGALHMVTKDEMVLETYDNMQYLMRISQGFVDYAILYLSGLCDSSASVKVMNSDEITEVFRKSKRIRLDYERSEQIGRAHV